MPCLNPRPSVRDETGVTHFGEYSADSWHEPVDVDCNRCHACMARRKRDWAIRCVHEAEEDTRTVQLPEGPHAEISDSCFVTLTYSDQFLPPGANLEKTAISGFMQRVRQARPGQRIRYMACGEYGAKGRPHYHGILFGVSFHGDRVPLHRGSDAAFQSEELEEIWGCGKTELGPCNYATAAYVAGYVVKKAYDEAAVLRPHDREPYSLIANPDGTWREAAPEFNSVTRNPGIGRRWIERNLDEVYARDSVIVDGKEFRPPKFYDKVLNETRPDHYAIVARRRQEHTAGRPLSTGLERRARRSLFEGKLGQRKQTQD